MRLGVSFRITKDVSYFSLEGWNVVGINFKLILQLELLVVKGGVGSIT